MFRQGYYSFLLAQIWGIFFLLVAIIVMSRMNYYRKLVLQMQAENGLIPLFACAMTFVGVILVVTHDVWIAGRGMVVTIVAWMVLISGIVGLAMPEFLLAAIKKVFSGAGCYVLMTVFLILGVVFLSISLQIFILNRHAVLVH